MSIKTKMLECRVRYPAQRSDELQTFKRICIKDWEITTENGDHFEVKRGKEYLTSAVNDAPAIGPEAEEGHVIVFSNFWVPVPINVFAGEIQFTGI